MAFWLSLVFMVVIVFVINNAVLFRADILQRPEELPSQEILAGDIRYELADWFLSIYTQRDFPVLDSLSLYVMYDPERSALKNSTVQTSFAYSSSSFNENMVSFVFTSLGTLKADSLIMKIWYSGDQEGLVVSNVSAVFTQEWFESLSVHRK